MNIDLAPDKGMMYALYLDRMVYKPYERANLPNTAEILTGLLELHLFDDKKEYRYVNKRDGQPIELSIECVNVLSGTFGKKETFKIKYGDDSKSDSDDREKPETVDIYEETIYTLGKGEEHISNDGDNKEKVGLVNYITYDENDLLVIENYRLKMIKEVSYE